MEKSNQRTFQYLFICDPWKKVFSHDMRVSKWWQNQELLFIKHSLSQWPNPHCSFISVSFALSYRLSLVVSAETVLSANWLLGLVDTELCWYFFQSSGCLMDQASFYCAELHPSTWVTELNEDRAFGSATITSCQILFLRAQEEDW